MAIWSLTQERVDKLLKQIGDKQMEIDALIKLTPKDLWNNDLDAFVNEWNTQLDEDTKRAKKIANIGRRASQKLGIAAKGKAKKRRKMDDSDTPSDSDSDFGGPAKKKAAVSKPKPGGLLSYLRKDEPAKKPSATEALKKGAASGSAAPKQGGMLSYLTKEEPTPVIDDAMDVDEPAPAAAPAAAAPASKRGRPAASKAKKPTPVSLDSDEDSDVFAAVAKEVSKKPSETVTTSRAARGATKQAPKYTMDDSDSDELGDNMLDVSSMVKTIGGASNERPLFNSSNRPGSGNGRPASATGISAKLPSRLGAQKSSPIEDNDETNYEGLMPQASPLKPAPRNVNDTIMGSDDEDDFGFSVKKPKPVAKPVAKPVKAAPKAASKTTKPAPKPKAAASTVVAKKTTQLSPAAKAYAAKFGKVKDAKPASKSKKSVDSDEEMEDADDLANDILSDDDADEPTPKPAAARPGRRAAAQPAKYVVSDDDDDDASEPDFDDDDDSE